MRMSESEKLIVLLLCEILSKFSVKSELDPEFIHDVVIANQAWAIPWRYSALETPSSEEPGAVRETCDILTMCSVVEQSIRDLPEADRNLLGYNEKIFEGFDANKDEHYAIAETLIRKLGRFSEFFSAELNSHSAHSIEKYSRMFEQFQAVYVGRELSLDELKRIVQA